MNNPSNYLKLSEEPFLDDSRKQTNSDTDNSFFCREGVKERKNRALKERLRTLIFQKKMSEPEFFNSLGITRQHWYSISWGLWPCPTELKIKIAERLGVDSILIWRGVTDD